MWEGVRLWWVVLESLDDIGIGVRGAQYSGSTATSLRTLLRKTLVLERMPMGYHFVPLAFHELRPALGDMFCKTLPLDKLNTLMSCHLN